MKSLTRPHDKFFKQIFTEKENAEDLIKGSLPEEVKENIDFKTLKLDKESYIDEELKEFYSDIVYNSVYKNKLTMKISILLEHKSQYVSEPHVQLLKYIVNIWYANEKQDQKKPLVVPIIIYHGEEEWKVRKLSEYFKGIDKTLKRFVPEFDYVLVDLSGYSDKEIKDEIFHRFATQTALLIMKNIFDIKKLEKNLVDYLNICKFYFEEKKGLNFLKSIINYST